MKRKVIALLAYLAVVNVAMGQTLYERYIDAANKGDAVAQFQIGYSYFHGLGPKENYTEANMWLNKAIAQGNVDAKALLGECYIQGYGVKKDKKEGFRLINEAVNQGSMFAMMYLGKCYFFKYGVKKDEKRGLEIIRKAAEQGERESQNYLGALYELGAFVDKDMAQASYWYRKAAEQGHHLGQMNLGANYFEGGGVPLDYKLAAYWMGKAFEQGWKDNYYAPKYETALEKIGGKQNLIGINGNEGQSSLAMQGNRSETTKSQNEMASSNVKSSLKSQVDVAIPENNINNQYLFAVIIGNEKYVNESDVLFAENDAQVFCEYLKKTLGVPEKQVRYVANGGLNSIRMAVRWLTQAMEVCNGQGKAIFYYAGHGIPDEANKAAYLLPVDGMGSDVESGYALERLYKELGKCTAEHIIVFLDACFSGTKREGDMMASARGVAIKVKSSDPTGNMIVFTASQGDETAYPYQEEQHGMFTYYLLKKLQETKGNATLGELRDYLSLEVKRQSFVENNKMQTPTVNVSSSLQSSWRNMKLK